MAQKMSAGMSQQKRLLRKVDLYVIPPLTLLYFFSFLDRTNIAYASIQGLKTDLELTDAQYLNGLTLFFTGYIIGEFPSVFALKVLSPQLWLPVLTLIWGLVACLNGVMVTVSGYYAARFFLGLSEAGLFPGIIYVISLYYRCSEQPLRIALFFSAATLAGTFGGILAYGISQINDVGLGGWFHSWRWIFIIEGLLTVLVGCFAFRFVPSDPLTAKFVKTPEEKKMLANHISNGDMTDCEDFDWKGVWSAFRDPKCWLYAIILHTLDLPQYTIALFLPSIIKAMGFTSAQAQLLTVPPYAVATITTIGNALLAQHFGYRAPFIIIPAAIGIIGYILLLAVPTSQSPGVAYLGTFLVLAGVFPACAIVLSWPASNVSGPTKRATACAGQIFIGFIGAVIGTQVYRNGADTIAGASPTYILGHAVACGYLAMTIVLTMITWLVLTRENERRKRALKEQGLLLPEYTASTAGVAVGDNAARDGDLPIDDVPKWCRDESLRWTFQT